MLVKKENVPQVSDYPEVMSRVDVARFLGISPKSVETYTKKGLLPYKRLGRRFLYSKTTLLHWLENNDGNRLAKP